MPAGKTYVKIASQTLSSNQASVTFSNLPQNYTDLVLVVAGTHTGAGVAGLYISSINSDAGTNYSRTLLQGNGSTASSTRGTNEDSMNIGLIGSTQTNSIFQFMNYSNSTTFKTILARGNDSSALVRASVALWRNTSAITSFSLSGVTFSSGTTFNLYGIEAAKSPYAEGGDKVYSTGTHWVHEFYNSGTFVPRQNLTADYLVVAGGGGAGYGGGGAGGLRSTVTATGGGGSLESALSLIGNTGYTVTVGAGGSGGPYSASAASNGNNSVFSTITSTGGGRGANGDNVAGTTGGSGGGGSTNNQAAGSGTANQGYAGGAGFSQNDAGGGGGGGGAGAVGTAAVRLTPPNANGGNGGNGVATSITGSSITYAGGGGGGAQGTGTPGSAGTGGGGAGVGNAAGNSGTANTGGGGGGMLSQNGVTKGGNGGSGIVIVRYAV